MNTSRKGFTIIELLVVVALAAILLATIVRGISAYRLRSRDDLRLAHMQTIQLALEEYRASCGVYPEQLALNINNARNGDCLFTLGDFLSTIPEAPNYAASLGNLSDGYAYVGLTTSVGRPCFAYHLGVRIEGDGSAVLEEDHDLNAQDSRYSQACLGSNPFGSNTDPTDDATELIYDITSIPIEDRS